MSKKVVSLAALASVMLLSGCAREPVWVERHVPITDAERAAVAAMIEKILAATPRTLSGHDQDWDDAISEARRTAEATLCKPTYWERAPSAPYSEVWVYTGRWRRGNEVVHEDVDGAGEYPVLPSPGRGAR